MKRFTVNGKFIDFDDVTEDEEYKIEWTQMCKHCAEKFKGIIPETIICEDGSGICGVKGCNNESDYYIDFPIGKLKDIKYKVKYIDNLNGIIKKTEQSFETSEQAEKAIREDCSNVGDMFGIYICETNYRTTEISERNGNRYCKYIRLWE